MGVPSGEIGSNGAYSTDGQELKRDLSNAAQANFTLSGSGYFSTLGIPLLHGRDFDSGDNYDHPFVAIISDSLARQSFAGKDPIGHSIVCGLDSPKWMTVVGVVADVRQDSPGDSPRPTIYMPLRQHPYFANQLQMVMRSAVSPDSLIDLVRSKMRALKPEVATKFTTMEAMVSNSIPTARLRVMLAGLFAGVALLLAVAGMYGVMNYVTTQSIRRIRRTDGTWSLATQRVGSGYAARGATDGAGRHRWPGFCVFRSTSAKHPAVWLESHRCDYLRRGAAGSDAHRGAGSGHSSLASGPAWTRWWRSATSSPSG